MTEVMTEVDEEERVRILKARIAELEAADDAEESDDDVQIMEEPSSSPPPSSGDDEAEEETTTTAQEAVNSQKSRRSREFEELRKLAANRKSEEGGELSAYERMQLKKQEELDALRARGDVNAANKSRFDTGQALTTDMSAFERTQKLAAEAERKKRLEASEGLKKNASGISSWDRNQLLGKDEARRRQMEAKEGLHSYRLSLNPSKSYDESPEKKPVVVAAQEAEKDSENNVDEVIPKPKQEAPINKEQEPEIAVEKSLPKAKEDAAAKPQSSVHKPPTYSRVDIKFSFGLVVKSGTTDESLRESETLRKCMNGTRDILTEELPAPPKESDITADSNVSFPQAYYDPILEPTVISIQEDTSKKPAKGKNNTRTLCKASFPIFIREETKDDDGKKRAALSLKETKGTIFKALRAAVSGGNFLK
mmetsp:Transcript_33618/g.49596  ORF Transcript_33618/g.49596 Transcript_33618/m.49596 type:complete len:423 (+) Transcript_33618:71-1339(+)